MNFKLSSTNQMPTTSAYQASEALGLNNKATGGKSSVATPTGLANATSSTLASSNYLASLGINPVLSTGITGLSTGTTTLPTGTDSKENDDKYSYYYVASNGKKVYMTDEQYETYVNSDAAKTGMLVRNYNETTAKAGTGTHYSTSGVEKMAGHYVDVQNNQSASEAYQKAVSENTAKGNELKDDSYNFFRETGQNVGLGLTTWKNGFVNWLDSVNDMFQGDSDTGVDWLDILAGGNQAYTQAANLAQQNDINYAKWKYAANIAQQVTVSGVQNIADTLLATAIAFATGGISAAVSGAASTLTATERMALAAKGAMAAGARTLGIAGADTGSEVLFGLAKKMLVHNENISLNIMAVRVLGDSYENLSGQFGITNSQALTDAFAHALIEYGTEKMSGFGDIGAMGNKVTSLDALWRTVAENVTRTSIGSMLVQGFLGEGFEEVVAGIAENVLIDVEGSYDPILGAQDKNSFADLVTAGLVGGISGMLGAGTRSAAMYGLYGSANALRETQRINNAVRLANELGASNIGVRAVAEGTLRQTQEERQNIKSQVNQEAAAAGVESAKQAVQAAAQLHNVGLTYTEILEAASEIHDETSVEEAQSIFAELKADVENQTAANEETVKEQMKQERLREKLKTDYEKAELNQKKLETERKRKAAKVGATNVWLKDNGLLDPNSEAAKALKAEENQGKPVSETKLDAVESKYSDKPISKVPKSFLKLVAEGRAKSNRFTQEQAKARLSQLEERESNKKKLRDEKNKPTEKPTVPKASAATTEEHITPESITRPTTKESTKTPVEEPVAPLPTGEEDFTPPSNLNEEEPDLGPDMSPLPTGEDYFDEPDESMLGIDQAEPDWDDEETYKRLRFDASQLREDTEDDWNLEDIPVSTRGEEPDLGPNVSFTPTSEEERTPPVTERDIAIDEAAEKLEGIDAESIGKSANTDIRVEDSKRVVKKAAEGNITTDDIVDAVEAAGEAAKEAINSTEEAKSVEETASEIADKINSEKGREIDVNTLREQLTDTFAKILLDTVNDLGFKFYAYTSEEMMELFPAEEGKIYGLTKSEDGTISLLCNDGETIEFQEHYGLDHLIAHECAHAIIGNLEYKNNTGKLNPVEQRNYKQIERMYNLALKEYEKRTGKDAKKYQGFANVTEFSAELVNGKFREFLATIDMAGVNSDFVRVLSKFVGKESSTLLEQLYGVDDLFAYQNTFKYHKALDGLDGGHYFTSAMLQAKQVDGITTLLQEALKKHDRVKANKINNETGTEEYEHIQKEKEKTKAKEKVRKKNFVHSALGVRSNIDNPFATDEYKPGKNNISFDAIRTNPETKLSMYYRRVTPDKEGNNMEYFVFDGNTCIAAIAAAHDAYGKALAIMNGNTNFYYTAKIKIDIANSAFDDITESQVKASQQKQNYMRKNQGKDMTAVEMEAEKEIADMGKEMASGIEANKAYTNKGSLDLTGESFKIDFETDYSNFVLDTVADHVKGTRKHSTRLDVKFIESTGLEREDFETKRDIILDRIYMNGIDVEINGENIHYEFYHATANDMKHDKIRMLPGEIIGNHETQWNMREKLAKLEAKDKKTESDKATIEQLKLRLDLNGGLDMEEIHKTGSKILTNGSVTETGSVKFTDVAAQEEIKKENDEKFGTQRTYRTFNGKGKMNEVIVIHDINQQNGAALIMGVSEHVGQFSKELEGQWGVAVDGQGITDGSTFQARGANGVKGVLVRADNWQKTLIEQGTKFLNEKGTQTLWADEYGRVYTEEELAELGEVVTDESNRKFFKGDFEANPMSGFFNGEFVLYNDWNEPQVITEDTHHIMTDSMVKFAGSYSGAEDFYNRCGKQDIRIIPKENVYGAFWDEAEEASDTPEMAALNEKKVLGVRQMLRGLDVTPEEAKKIVRNTEDWIASVQSNPEKQMQLLKGTNRFTAYILDKAPELMNTTWANTQLETTYNRLRYSTSFGKPLGNRGDYQYGWIVADPKSMLSYLMGNVTTYSAEEALALDGIKHAPDNFHGTSKVAKENTLGTGLNTNNKQLAEGYDKENIVAPNLKEGLTAIGRSPTTGKHDIRAVANNTSYFEEGFDRDLVYIALDSSLKLRLDNDFDGDTAILLQDLEICKIILKNQQKAMATVTNGHNEDAVTTFPHGKAKKMESSDATLMYALREALKDAKIGMYDTLLDKIYSSKFLPHDLMEEYASVAAAGYILATDYTKTAFMPEEFLKYIDDVSALLRAHAVKDSKTGSVYCCDYVTHNRWTITSNGELIWHGIEEFSDGIEKQLKYSRESVAGTPEYFAAGKAGKLEQYKKKHGVDKNGLAKMSENAAGGNKGLQTLYENKQKQLEHLSRVTTTHFGEAVRYFSNVDKTEPSKAHLVDALFFEEHYEKNVPQGNYGQNRTTLLGKGKTTKLEDIQTNANVWNSMMLGGHSINEYSTNNAKVLSAAQSVKASLRSGTRYSDATLEMKIADAYKAIATKGYDIDAFNTVVATFGKVIGFNSISQSMLGQYIMMQQENPDGQDFWAICNQYFNTEDEHTLRAPKKKAEPALAESAPVNSTPANSAPAKVTANVPAKATTKATAKAPVSNKTSNPMAAKGGNAYVNNNSEVVYTDKFGNMFTETVSGASTEAVINSYVARHGNEKFSYSGRKESSINSIIDGCSKNYKALEICMHTMLEHNDIIRLLCVLNSDKVKDARYDNAAHIEDINCATELYKWAVNHKDILKKNGITAEALRDVAAEVFPDTGVFKNFSLSDSSNKSNTKSEVNPYEYTRTKDGKTIKRFSYKDRNGKQYTEINTGKRGNFSSYAAMTFLDKIDYLSNNKAKRLSEVISLCVQDPTVLPKYINKMLKNNDVVTALAVLYDYDVGNAASSEKYAKLRDTMTKEILSWAKTHPEVLEKAGLNYNVVAGTCVYYGADIAFFKAEDEDNSPFDMDEEEQNDGEGIPVDFSFDPSELDTSSWGFAPTNETNTNQEQTPVEQTPAEEPTIEEPTTENSTVEDEEPDFGPDESPFGKDEEEQNYYDQYEQDENGFAGGPDTNQSTKDRVQEDADEEAYIKFRQRNIEEAVDDKAEIEARLKKFFDSFIPNAKKKEAAKGMLESAYGLQNFMNQLLAGENVAKQFLDFWHYNADTKENPYFMNEKVPQLLVALNEEGSKLYTTEQSITRYTYLVSEVCHEVTRQLEHVSYNQNEAKSLGEELHELSEDKDAAINKVMKGTNIVSRHIIDQLKPGTLLKIMGRFNKDSSAYKLGKRIEKAGITEQTLQTILPQRLYEMAHECGIARDGKLDSKATKDAIRNSLKGTISEGTFAGMTKGDVAYIYMLSKSTVGEYNLRNGGFEDAEGEAAKFTQETLKEAEAIVNNDKVLKAFCDMSHNIMTDFAPYVKEYKNKAMGTNIKEVDPNYMPLRKGLSKDVAERHIDTNAELLDSISSLQHRQKDSYDVIRRTNLLDLVEEYSVTMSHAVAWGELQTDLIMMSNASIQSNATYNFMNSLYENGYGHVADYIQDLSNDISGKKHAEGFIYDILDNFASATLSVNGSVALKQKASLSNAAAVVPTKYLKEYWGLPSFHTKQFLEDERIKALSKYTKIIEARRNDIDRISSISRNTKNIYGESFNFTGIRATVDEYTPDAIKSMIPGVDVQTVCRVAYACWDWTADEMNLDSKNIDELVENERFMELYSERTEQAISETNPMYNMAFKNKYQRSTGIMRTVMMFRSQQTQNFNNIVEGYFEAQETGDRTRLEGATKGLAVSSLEFALLGLLSRGLLGNWEDFEDDDGNFDVLSCIESLGINAFGSVAGTDAIAGYLGDMFKAAFMGENYYGIEANGFAQISDFTTSTVSFITNVFKGNGSKAAKYGWKTVQAFSVLAGVPLTNAYKMVMAIPNNINNVAAKLEARKAVAEEVAKATGTTVEEVMAELDDTDETETNYEAPASEEKEVEKNSVYGLSFGDSIVDSAIQSAAVSNYYTEAADAILEKYGMTSENTEGYSNIRSEVIKSLKEMDNQTSSVYGLSTGNDIIDDAINDAYLTSYYSNAADSLLGSYGMSSSNTTDYSSIKSNVVSSLKSMDKEYNATVDEYSAAFTNIFNSVEDYSTVKNYLDANGNGSITQTELKEAYANATSSEEKALIAAFWDAYGTTVSTPWSTKAAKALK